ncbi:carbamate kinase [Natronincola ferrireducens]|uniref:Carbamate kinase n=1 Tax=Natronincola ferrireducens TaxID=393762 RepID=A0A1G9G214_9FIRM|nr:carbamate kinase [Natronincola ferrireducens]SDK94343.1 carbamate kinase [Natronincola ferrireducens]
MKKVAVIAIGGNAIIQEGQRGTIEEQFENILQSCDPILDLTEAGYNVVLTHGNGPQVGNVLLKVEAANGIVPPYPLDVCGAETQGSLGYIIQQSLYNRMKARGIKKDIATVVTQVVVDEKDPGFENPTKPIGPFYTKERAAEIAREKKVVMTEDSGRGYRRVVPSPQPLELVEKEAVKRLVDNDFLVITVGGGGIPVVKDGENLRGVEAVIDKDHASALVAQEINANYLIVLTGVPQVAINFGKENQEFLKEMTLADAKRHFEEGQFPPGSMGPKIEAAIRFVENGEGEAIITSIDKLQEALKGETGTRIIK